MAGPCMLTRVACRRRAIACACDPAHHHCPQPSMTCRPSSAPARPPTVPSTNLSHDHEGSLTNCCYCRAEQGCSEEGERNNNQDKAELKHGGQTTALSGSDEEGRRE
jgi:hypothetical protein